MKLIRHYVEIKNIKYKNIFFAAAINFANRSRIFPIGLAQVAVNCVAVTRELIEALRESVRTAYRWNNDDRVNVMRNEKPTARSKTLLGINQDRVHGARVVLLPSR